MIDFDTQQQQQQRAETVSPYDAARTLINFTRNTTNSSSSVATDELSLRTPATPLTPATNMVPPLIPMAPMGFPMMDPSSMMWMQPTPQMMMPFMMPQQVDFNRQFEAFLSTWNLANSSQQAVAPESTAPQTTTPQTSSSTSSVVTPASVEASQQDGAPITAVAQEAPIESK